MLRGFAIASIAAASLFFAACSGSLRVNGEDAGSNGGNGNSDAGGSDAGTSDAGSNDGGLIACVTANDCPLNTGASCSAVCPDRSNPCIAACVNKLCEPRGCPGAYPQPAACDVNSDCPPLNSCTLTCADGGGAPCQDICLDNLCAMAGCDPFGAGDCHPNGAACSRLEDCCSGNCITGRGPTGFCCEPGGCP